MLEPDDYIADLTARLADYPLSAWPVEHATIQFNLGVALSEHPLRTPTMLRRAVGHHATALKVFDAATWPVERSRVLTALGSAERSLGMMAVAVDRFRSAADLVDADNPAEAGSALNNLGLALAEMGRLSEAEAVFVETLESFSDERFSRQRATTLYNRGQMYAASGRSAEAIEAFRAGIAEVSPEIEGPLWGTISHELGVALMQRAEADEDIWNEAVSRLEDALSIFNRRSYPLQYAMANHNLGLAHAGRPAASVSRLRRAVVSFEDALTVLDVHTHADPRREVSAAMEAALARLEDLGHSRDRAEHFVALVASLAGGERTRMLRARLQRVLDTPEPGRTSQLAALDRALIRLPAPHLADLTIEWMHGLTEDRLDAASAAFETRVAMIGELDDPTEATAALERAIGELEIIIRMQVRGVLEAHGYERPQ